MVGRYNEAVGRLIAPELVAKDRQRWLAALRGSVNATVTYMWDDPLTPVIVQETIKDASVAAENERWLRLTSRRSPYISGGHGPRVTCRPITTRKSGRGSAGGMRQIMRLFIARTEAPAFAVVRRETWNFVKRQVTGDTTDVEAMSTSGTEA